MRLNFGRDNMSEQDHGQNLPLTPTNTSFRKLSHIEICLKNDVSSHHSTGFEDFYLLHRALCNLDLDKIDTSISCFGKKLKMPLMISAMTGGHPDVRVINENIAKVVDRFQLAMGVGSERAAMEQDIPYIQESFRIVRTIAPSAVIFGNLGAAQFSSRGKFGIQEIQKAIDLIQADAMAIHINPAQELMQLEGDTSFHNVVAKIKELAPLIPIPIILKEVGSGFSQEDAGLIADSAIAGIDIGGLGGTSWVAVEALRALQKNERLQYEIGKVFWDWGIPTAISLAEVRSCLPSSKFVIATGGIRSGLDAAKAIALGADLVGMALPFLKAAQQGLDELDFQIRKFHRELQIAILLTGCQTLQDLRKIPIIVTGMSREWLTSRGIDLQLKWREQLKIGNYDCL